jgi:hypothetical protein
MNVVLSKLQAYRLRPFHDLFRWHTEAKASNEHGLIRSTALGFCWGLRGHHCDALSFCKCHAIGNCLMRVQRMQSEGKNKSRPGALAHNAQFKLGADGLAWSRRSPRELYSRSAFSGLTRTPVPT